MNTFPATNTHAYCEHCRSMQPILYAPANESGIDVTGHFENGTDMLCARCDSVIATTCRPRQPPSQGGNEEKA